MAATLRELYGDVPLRYEFSEAPIAGIKEFTAETKILLAQEGLTVILPLNRLTLVQLRTEGRPFYGDFILEPDIENLPSRGSEAAINPHRIYLPNSHEKTFPEQVKMLAEYNRVLQGRVPGVEAIIGEVPDYSEFFFRYLDLTGETIPPHDDEAGCIGYVQTATVREGPGRKRRFAVGGLSAEDRKLGFHIPEDDSSYNRHGINLLPLIVPKAA